MLGFVCGYVFAIIAVAEWSAANGLRTPRGSASQTMGTVVAGLLGLWVGLIGAPVVASRVKGAGRLRTDFGLWLRPWPDVPVGIAVGVGSQYLLVNLVYLPLRPFVSHLDQRLSQPAHQVTGGAQGLGFVVVALLLTIGAPVVEELFFRGLVLRSLERRLASLGSVVGPVLSVGLSALVFGLAHDESLQLLGLVAFGVVLAVLARSYGRLGPGIMAHASFNAVTVIALAYTH